MRNESGQATVPLLLLFTTGLVAAFGSWGLLRLHFRQAELQLGLDSCVGRKAVELRDLLRFVESSNVRITSLRASVVAASFQPELIPPLQRWLEAEAALQEVRLSNWRVGIAGWMAGAACGPVSAAVVTSVPGVRLVRPNRDVVGPLPLEWIGEEPRTLHFAVAARERSAAAEVRRHPATSPLEEKWTAHWTIPSAPAARRANTGNPFSRR